MEPWMLHQMTCVVSMTRNCFKMA